MTEKTKKERLEESLKTIDILVKGSRDPLTMEQQEDIDRIIDALKETLSEPESEINKTMH